MICQYVVFFFQKVIQPSEATWGKISTYYNSVNCRTTFSNNLQVKVFCMSVLVSYIVFGVSGMRQKGRHYDTSLRIGETKCLDV